MSAFRRGLPAGLLSVALVPALAGGSLWADAAPNAWPKFRFDAANTGFNPAETSLSESNVAGLSVSWSSNRHYGIWDSPVIVNGVVYLACQTALTSPPTTEECATSAQDGRLLWHTVVGTTFDPSGAAVSNGVVYVGGQRPGIMYALDAASGATLWTSQPATKPQDFYSAPSVVNGVVYAAADDGYLHAFDGTTGVELWSVADHTSASTPAVADNIIYLEASPNGNALGMLYAFDFSGKLLWTSSGQYGYPMGSAMVADGLVFVGSNNDNAHLDTNIYAYRAAGCGASICDPVWSYGAPRPPFTSPGYANGVLYEGVADGKLYAFNAASGALLWQGLTDGMNAAIPWAVQGAPSIANGVVYAGSGDGHLYAWRASGCGTATCQPLWKADIGASTADQVYASPAIVDGTVYINSSNWTLYAFRLGSPAPSPGPAGWDSLGGTMTSGPDVASWGPGRLDVFAAGPNHELLHKYYDGSWHAWENLGGYLRGDPGAVSWGPNRLDVVVRGGDDQLWHKWWDGTGWSGWQPLGGVLTAGADISSWASGRLDVFVRGGDNGLWHKWWDGSAWSGWQSLGGWMTADAGAVSWGPDRIDVFSRQADNQLSHTWWDGQRWNAWQALGGTLGTGPDVASWTSGRLDVFAVGVDGQLWRRFWDGVAWSGWEPWGGQLTSDPGAVSWGPGRIDVFARGTDNAIWHRWIG